MKLAVVGTGNIVKKFLYGVAAADGLQPVAVCSRSTDSAKRFIAACDSLDQESTRIVTDYEELLADKEIEIVYIALPNSLHYSYSKRALLAGKHVICEKPFTVEAAETGELIRIAKERQLFLFEAITTRNLPNYQIVKEQLPRVGTIRMVQCNFSQYSSRYDEYLSGQTPNVFHPDFAGGALNDLNIYNFHFVVGLFGRPETYHYFANEGRLGIDLSGVAVLGYDGFQAVCVAAKDSSSPNFVFIQGEKGYIYVNGQSSRCRRIEVNVNGQSEFFGEEQTEENVLVYEVRNFDRIIRDKDFLTCYRKLEESKEVMEVLEETRRTWK